MKKRIIVQYNCQRPTWELFDKPLRLRYCLCKFCHSNAVQNYKSMYYYSKLIDFVNCVTFVSKPSYEESDPHEAHLTCEVINFKD